MAVDRARYNKHPHDRTPTSLGIETMSAPQVRNSAEVEDTWYKKLTAIQ
jgi:hypothetical protein